MVDSNRKRNKLGGDMALISEGVKPKIKKEEFFEFGECDAQMGLVARVKRHVYLIPNMVSILSFKITKSDSLEEIVDMDDIFLRYGLVMTNEFLAAHCGHTFLRAEFNNYDEKAIPVRVGPTTLTIYSECIFAYVTKLPI